jgi:non-reducing end alpha-L-arabinofuranosidase
MKRMVFSLLLLIGSASAGWSIIQDYGVSGGPCDLFSRNHTPCVAAHSFTRRLISSYSGPLFQIKQNNTRYTLDVGFNKDTGVVDTSGIASFCSGVTCVYTKVYDQIGRNTLANASVGRQAAYATYTFPHSSVLPYFSSTTANPSQWLRNRTGTLNIPTGNSSIAVEYVRTTEALGVGDYGNMERAVADHGTGHMFALCLCGHLGIDHEDGTFEPGPIFPPTVFNFEADHDRRNHTTRLNYGDATTGTLTNIYNGADPVAWAMEGALALGEGGDGTAAGSRFFEGWVLASVPSSATLNAVQQNIVNFYGPL